MKLNKSQMMKKIVEMLAEQEICKNSFEGNENPQVKKMYIETMAKIDVLEDVLALGNKNIR